MLKSIVKDSKKPVQSLSLLGEEEKRQITVDWNKTEEDVYLHSKQNNKSVVCSTDMKMQKLPLGKKNYPGCPSITISQTLPHIFIHR